MARTTNTAGLALIKEFEGLRLKVYLDVAGKPTVGVGHLVLPTDHLKVGQTITAEQADELLRTDLAKAEAAVNRAFVPEALTDNQFSALVSFTYNLGEGGLRKLISRGTAAIPNRMLMFDHDAGGKQVLGLTRRRIAERALYLNA